MNATTNTLFELEKEIVYEIVGYLTEKYDARCHFPNYGMNHYANWAELSIKIRSHELRFELGFETTDNEFGVFKFFTGDGCPVCFDIKNPDFSPKIISDVILNHLAGRS